MPSTPDSPKTIPDLFFDRVKVSGSKDAVIYKTNGRWHHQTWYELDKQIRRLAATTARWIQPGDNVCILSENCPEWWIADLAIQMLGGITVPLYTSSPTKDIVYILKDCEAKVIFVSNAALVDKITALSAENAIEIQRVITFEEQQRTTEEIISLKELLADNDANEEIAHQRHKAIHPDDLATLIYTSGTSGMPKGVMLTHRNILSNTIGAASLINLIDFEEKLLLSFLPLSHSFERVTGYYAAIYLDAKVAFAESLERLAENLVEIHPTILISVPRVYEKIYAKVLDAAQRGVNKKIVPWALRIGQEHLKYHLSQSPPPLTLMASYRIANKMVFEKIQTSLGGRLKCAVCGGAPLAREIIEFFYAIGIPIYEGYGLTETAPIVCANVPGKTKIGSVGRPWPNVEIKIDPEPGRFMDGEILVKGPNVMKGYFKQLQMTDEAFTEDGWFRTGDIGYQDQEGYLFITDRKKELIKTAGGKYVAPQPIESQLKLHPLIEQAVVIGNHRKYCIALFVPNFEKLTDTLVKPLPGDRKLLNDDPQVRSLFQAIVDGVNKNLGTWEQIKRFYLLPNELTQESGELTPTLKVKRFLIDEKYKNIIDRLYPSPY